MADDNPRERLIAQGVGQLEICTRHCGARCCRYITVDFATPVGERDWDQVRWWLAHEGTEVTKDEDGWTLHVLLRCRHLAADNTCAAYEDRMQVCEEYDAVDCEFTADYDYEVRLTSESDLADYLERRKLKRGRRVASAIRAQARRAAGGKLVQLEGLDARD
jgi:hypothetical protein